MTGYRTFHEDLSPNSHIADICCVCSLIRVSRSFVSMSEPAALEIPCTESELFGCWCKRVVTTGGTHLTRCSAHCSYDPSMMTRLSSHEPAYMNTKSKRTEAKDAEETNISLQTGNPENNRKRIRAQALRKDSWFTQRDGGLVQFRYPKQEARHPVETSNWAAALPEGSSCYYAHLR